MRLFIVFAMMVAGITFAVQNAPAVTVNLFLWRFDAPLALIITACFAAGALMTLLASLPHLYRLYRMHSHEQHGRSQAPLAH